MELRLDDHKLMYHPERVAQWLREGDAFPIEIEVGLANRCQHRCVYCAFDYLHYKGPVLAAATVERALGSAKAKGLKSVVFSGEGEPLMHPELADIVKFSRSLGLDVALMTNGLGFEPKIAEKLLEHLTWVRFSVDANTEKTYREIHRCLEGHFSSVLSNIARAVERNKKEHLGVTIGVQALLLHQEPCEIEQLATSCQIMGVDYLMIKPFSKHPSSICDFDINYERYLDLEVNLKAKETPDFRVYYRNSAMERLGETKPYGECLGLSFMTVLSSTGLVYPCNMFVGQPEYAYGDIHYQLLSDIWASPQREKVNRILRERGTSGCRESCRIDPANRYLWDLKHPSAHVNFI